MSKRHGAREIALVRRSERGGVTARFRCYAELNAFLPFECRWQEMAVPCAREATTKHMIEALGIPHTEVELILVDGQAVGFDHRLQQGERVSVYPHFTALDITAMIGVRQAPVAVGRFIADSHLGGLARLLRMAGFDTLYRNDYADREIVRIAVEQGRIVLTRDRDLLKHRAVTHGCYVHAIVPARQFGEIVRRLGLARSMQPLSRCLKCNALLFDVAKAAVSELLPPLVSANRMRFTACPVCRRIYWQGTHWQRMRDFLHAALSATESPTNAVRSGDEN
jgi:uncharacterized protein with PIN domain